jgi:ParB family transcriptional regulator, chromosome partitioning protein
VPTTHPTTDPTDRTSQPTTGPAEPAPPPDPQAGEYRQVPIAQLAENPLNLRRRLDGIDELAASVRAVGVLEPLIVTPAPGAGLLIVAGHRRHAAARHAGLSTVPCIVRDLDEAAIIQTALIENGHRQALTYLEEAEGLHRLMDLTALTVHELAGRVGRSPAWTSARLALLLLPEQAKQALQAASITLEVATQLTDLADYPEIIADLFDEGGRVDPDTLARAHRHVHTEREIARLLEQAAAKGLRVAEPAPGQRYLTTLPLSAAQQAAHRRQACHAVQVDRSYAKPRLVPICTQPDRHPTTTAHPTTSPTTPATDNPRTAQQQRERADFQRAETEHRRNLRRVAAARRQFLTTLLGKRLKRAEATAFVLAAVLTRAADPDLAAAGKLLGLTPGTTRWGQPDWRTPLTAHTAAGDQRLLTAAFAVAAAWAENRISAYSTGYDQTTAGYLTTLAALGYTPDPFETEQITAYPDQPDADAGPDQSGTAQAGQPDGDQADEPDEAA